MDNSKKLFENSQLGLKANNFSKGHMAINPINPINTMNNLNPFLHSRDVQITPKGNEIRNIYSMVDASPYKSLPTINEQSYTKNSFNFLDSTFARTTNFTSPNLTIVNSIDANSNKFNINSGAKNIVKYLTYEGEDKINETNETNETIKFQSKPVLTSVVSRNKLKDYSKSKKYLEDDHEFNSKVINYTKSKKMNNEHNNKENEISLKIVNEEVALENSTYEDESYNNYQQQQQQYDEKTLRLLELQKRLPVPIEKKDDEKFKILKMKELKRVSLPPNKSAQVTDLLSSPVTRKTIQEEDNYCTFKKKRLSHSAKKQYNSIFTLEEPITSEKYRFPVFRDSEIGINEYWQAHIIESKADEDLPTDNEQIQLAKHMTRQELGEAVEIFIEEGLNCLRNKKYLTVKGQ